MLHINKRNFIYLLLGTSLLVSGCAKTQEQKEIKEKENNITISLDGLVVPAQKQDVLSPVAGYLDTIYIKNGDKVKAGDHIYSMDKHLIEIDIQATKKEIAYLEQIRSKASDSGKNFIPAINLAASELNQVSALRSEGTTNRFDENNYKKTYMNTITNYKNNQITTYEKVKNLDVNIMSKRTQLEKLQYQYDHSDGYASIDGYIAGLTFTRGQSVNVDSKICSIVDIDTVNIQGGFASGLLAFIKKGEKISIDFVTTPPYHVDTSITQINPIVDPKFETMTLEAVVPNHDYILQEGTRALITITLPKKGQDEVKKYFMNKVSKDTTFQVKSNI